MRISSWKIVTHRDEHDLEFVPLHPGGYLRDNLLPSLGVSLTAFAKYVELPVEVLHELLNERLPVTPQFAQCLAEAFQNSARFWLDMQKAHDDWVHARADEARAKIIRAARESAA